MVLSGSEECLQQQIVSFTGHEQSTTSLSQGRAANIKLCKKNGPVKASEREESGFLLKWTEYH